MLRTVLLCWLAIGLVFGGIEAPAAAHEVPSSSVLAPMADHGSHADVAHRDHAPDDDETPCHAMVQHHHCTVSLGMASPVVFSGFIAERLTVLPSDSANLNSLAQAPPLQPPSL